MPLHGGGCGCTKGLGPGGVPAPDLPGPRRRSRLLEPGHSAPAPAPAAPR